MRQRCLNSLPTLAFCSLSFRCHDCPLSAPDGGDRVAFSTWPAQIHSPKRGGLLLAAQSGDGLKWTKPSLGIIEWPLGSGSKANNILQDFGDDSLTGGLGTGITMCPSASCPAGVASSGDKWKLMGEQGKALVVGSSSDGKVFKSHAVSTTEGRFDTHKNAVFDPVTRKWIGYIRCTPAPSDAQRVQCYTESDGPDYERASWGPAMPTGLNTSHEYEPDALVVFKYHNIWLGTYGEHAVEILQCH
eukprot:SAG22_NODE_104_length_20159_cov_5.877517_27_plen_245_part_00